MNIAALSQIASLAEEFGVSITGLMPLASLATLKVSDLTVDHLKTVCDALKIQSMPDEKTLAAVVAALQADDVNALADLIQDPELVRKVVGIINPKLVEDRNLIICPHCCGFITP